MRYVPLVTLIVGSLLVLWLLLSGPAPGAPAAAHAAGLASVETTAAPAPAGVVRAALRAERHARDARAEWARAKHCLGERPRLRVAGRPDRDSTAALWLRAKARWREQRADFELRTVKCVAKMRSPGGSGGERWRALALWVGWKPSEWPTVLYIMAKRWGHGESGGDPKAINPVPPYCRGLMQLARGWYTGAWRIRGVKQPFDPLDPEANLRAAEGIHDQQGWSPWAL